MLRALTLALVAAAAASAGGAWWWQSTPAASPVAEEQALEAAAPAERHALLERQLQRNPRDARARVLLARMDAEAGAHAAAAAGFERAIADSPKVARDAGVWVELAEAKALQQGGRLAGEPAKLVDHALALQATHPQALDLAGSAAYEAGDYKAAAAHWKQLLAALEPADARREPLTAAIARAEQRGRFALPPAR